MVMYIYMCSVVTLYALLCSGQLQQRMASFSCGEWDGFNVRKLPVLSEFCLPVSSWHYTQVEKQSNIR